MIPTTTDPTAQGGVSLPNQTSRPSLFLLLDIGIRV